MAKKRKKVGRKPTRKQRFNAQVERLVLGGMPKKQAEKQVRQALGS
ncbi:hypothetical protein [Adonisia turfae]|nr:hypothetical protein [Adonisia turfae]